MDETVKKSLLILILICPPISRAAYTPAELFKIKWGDNDTELMLIPEFVNNAGTPDDSTDDDSEPASGPDHAFVDSQGNVIFSSYGTRQLKGFSATGSLLFDYSVASSGYRPEFYLDAPSDVYVDSSGLLYITSFPELNYVPIVNYSGVLIDSLKPYPLNPNADIAGINWSTRGSLIIYSFDSGWITLSDGISTAGGSSGFLAANGSYYAIFVEDTNRLRFKKYEDPDSTGRAATRDSTSISTPVDSIYSASILDGGDGNFLYLLLAINDWKDTQVWIFDLQYNLLDILPLSAQGAYLDWQLQPFVAYNGTTYEFRCLDDGLHVVKWTKQ